MNRIRGSAWWGGPMVLYAADPARRTWQLLLDLLVVLWVVLAVWAGTQVTDALGGVADQVRQVDDAGTSLADNLTGAGDSLDGTPVVGDEVAAPFDRAAEASAGIAQAGADGADAVDRVAFWSGVVTALLLVLVALPWWLPGRVRFVLTATLARRYLRAGGDPDLYAVRALARQPVRVLARVPDAAAGWRRGDPATVAALATLELRAAGLAGVAPDDVPADAPATATAPAARPAPPRTPGGPPPGPPGP